MFLNARIAHVIILGLFSVAICSAQDQPPNQNDVDYNSDFPKAWKLAAQNAGVHAAPEDWKPILQNFKDTIRHGRETSLSRSVLQSLVRDAEKRNRGSSNGAPEKIDDDDIFYDYPFIINETSQILHVEWTQPNKSATVLATGRGFANRGNHLFVLHFEKQGVFWQIQDWHNLLLPGAASQFFTLVLSGNEPEYQQFKEKENSPRDPQQSSLDRAKQLFSFAMKIPASSPLRDYALVEICDELAPNPLFYPDTDKQEVWSLLDEIASEINPERCKAHLYFRGIAASGKNIPHEANPFKQLVDHFGWFPDIPSRLRKPEKPGECATYIASLCCRALYDEVTNSQYPLGDRLRWPMCPETATQLSIVIGPRKRAQTAFTRIVKHYSSNTDHLEILQSSMQNQKEALPFQATAEGMLAYRKRNWDKAAKYLLESARAFSEEVPEEEKFTFENELYDSLKRASQQKPIWSVVDKDALVAEFIYRGFLARWKIQEIGPLDLQLLRAARQLIQEDNLAISPPHVRGLCDSILDIKEQPDVVLDRLLNLAPGMIEQYNTQVLRRETPLSTGSLGWEHQKLFEDIPALFVLMRWAAIKSGGFETVHERLQHPDMAFLMEASSIRLPCEATRLADLLKRHEAHVNLYTDHWQHYYKSILAFSDGDWDEGDRLIFETYHQTSTSESYMAGECRLDPLEFLERGVFEKRREMAARSQKLPDMYRNVFERNEWGANYEFQDQFGGLTDLEVLHMDIERLRKTVKASEDDGDMESLLFLQSMLQRKYEQAYSIGRKIFTGDWFKSSDTWIAKHNNQYALLWFQCLQIHGDLDQIEQLKNVAGVEGVFWKVLFAIAEKDEEAFAKLTTDKLFSVAWLSLPASAQKQVFALNWTDVLLNSYNPESTLPFVPEKHASAVLLNVPKTADEALTEWDDKLRSQFPGLISLAKPTNIEGVEGCWELTYSKNKWMFLLVDLQRKEALRNYPDEHVSCIPDCRWALVIRSLSYPYNQDDEGALWQQHLDLCSRIVEQTPACLGLYDAISRSYWVKPDWTWMRAQANSQAIPKENPIPQYFHCNEPNVIQPNAYRRSREESFDSNNERPNPDDSFYITVSSSLLTEYVPARFHPQINETEFDTWEMLESSVLDPKIQKGKKYRVNRWEWILKDNVNR
ncbi:MAG: hypothetical protein MUC43_13475 [Pirellula sp.]|jgi:hypothetical protein|nr:hypothetical protein [Pirellula sp.]